MTGKGKAIQEEVIAYMESAGWHNMTPDTTAKENVLIFITSGLHLTAVLEGGYMHYLFDVFGKTLFQSAVSADKDPADIGREISFLATAISNCDEHYFKANHPVRRGATA